MPRHKIYDEGDRPMPKGVVQIVKCICADYDRRARAIPYTDNRDVRDTYIRMNTAVDSALLSITEPGIRDLMLRDMVCRRGYERSRAREMICGQSYYARRRKVLRLIAEELALI